MTDVELDERVSVLEETAGNCAMFLWSNNTCEQDSCIKRET